MMTQAFEKIAAGLGDAIAYAKGDAGRGVLHEALDVKAIRSATKLTQEKFSRTYHIPVSTLRDWEQGRRVPDTPARVLLGMIKIDPDAVKRLAGRIV